MSAPSRPQAVTGRRRVAITGIGVVSPVGNYPGVLWDNLLAGRSGVSRITTFDASAKRVQIAATVDDFTATDWMERREAIRFDRFCQLAMAASDLALKDAGELSADPSDVAVIIASALGGADTIRTTVGNDPDGERIPPTFIPVSMSNVAASVVAQRHDFGGPSYSPSSACASSADAVGQGMRMIRDGYADACVVGGSEACVNPVIMAGFASMRALSRRNDSPEQAARPFDTDRDGFVLGEGAAVLVLEDMDRALARGATLYAEIAGYGQTNDSHHLTAPRADGSSAARAIRTALRDAGIATTDVDYINAHGTGTVLNDRAEMAALRAVFGADLAKTVVGSTKSMTGHLLGAGGALEAAVAALAIKTSMIPPSVNLDQVAEDCAGASFISAPADSDVAAALTNSFAFGGHNSSLVLRRNDFYRTEE